MDDDGGRRSASENCPPETKPAKFGRPKKTAAGIPAALSTLKHGIGRMGLTRTWKTLTVVNQSDGFDCPGCAWPDPEGHRTKFEFCENGAKAVADEATKKKIGGKFFAKYSIQELSQQSDFWLNSRGRLVAPMYLAKGSNYYQPISWEEAISKISAKLRSLSNPNEAIFYTSGRTSNEAAFLYQLFARIFGTNNLPDCSNMCHESSGRGLGEVIGIGKGTVSLDDFNHASLILVIGQNPGTNHPRMLTALRDAKRKGAKIVHINPLPETGLQNFKHPQDYMKLKFGKDKLSDKFLQIRINSDAALLQGIMKILIEMDAEHNFLDHDFINDKTEGFDELCSHLDSVNMDEVVEQTGLSEEEIRSVAQMCAESKATIACWAMGLTQHRNGVAAIQDVVNLLLLGGHFGRKGAGACPVRGHSNVQGDRTMGIWERPSEQFLTKMDSFIGIESPREHGYDVVDAIHAMKDKKCALFFCLGGNFLSAAPDTEFTASAMRNVDMTVQVSTKLNRSHLVTGEEALILPCLGRTEKDLQAGGYQFVTVENSMSVVHMSRGSLKPASNDLLSEPAIIAKIANKTLDEPVVDWLNLISNYDRIRDLIEGSIAGFDDYNRRVRAQDGFVLPNPPRDTTSFNTPSGKAKFTTHDLPNLSISEGRFVMMTIRSHDQYNTTIYGLNDRYRGVKGGRRVVLMNPEDMEEKGLKKKQKVAIRSYFEDEIRSADDFAVLPYSIPRGNVATYFPEANVLVPSRSVADKSRTPTSKWVVVSIEE